MIKNKIEKSIRLNKYISSICNFCSRRKADQLIVDRKVRVNENIATKPMVWVNTNDIIKVGKTTMVPENKIRLWAYHKPIGSIVSKNNKNHHCKTIYELLPNNFKNKISIGRLDINTSGILLLTNNGDFARMLEHPSSKITREYILEILGDKKKIAQLNKKVKTAITINLIKYNIQELCIIKSKEIMHTIRIKLQEGKNREIRKICAHFDLKILKLKRVKFGNINLGKIKANQVIECSQKDIEHFLSKQTNEKTFLYDQKTPQNLG